jgi:uncharacterized membrane protein (UPF0182 family)
LDSFERQWQRWFPEDNEKQPARGWTAGRLLMILAGVLALFIVLSVGKGFYTEWLWFSNLGYGSVYGSILGTKVVVFFAAAAIFAVVFLANLVLATRLAPKTENHFWPWSIVSRLKSLIRLNVILGTVLLSLIFGLVAQGSWEVILRYFYGQPFGVTDPVFQREVSFYVFSLPFLHFMRGWLMSALIIILLGSAGVYLLSYAVQRIKFDYSLRVLAHITGLGIAILGLFAWGYWLGIWELVFSTRGAVFGASYADLNAKLPAQWILFAVVFLVIAVIVVSIVRRNFRWPLYAIGAWIAAAIIIGGIFPALVHRFQVQPNELARETPYIEYNIQFTREAFGLDKVEEQPFLAKDTPTAEELAENEVTINNVRLWDHRPLKDTYNQIQSIRLYYDFFDVDVDRYNLNGDYRQVMLSAREMSAEKLARQAQTWVNRRLQFTHGYGVVLSPVNEVSPEGLPILLMQDIPPIGEFDIERPEIYFGEKTNEYVIVRTRTPEFDYPSGDENVFGQYEGTGGVSLDGFVRRLVYAWQFGDFNILISNELTEESRIVYNRNIRDRVNHLAPFLELDSDPYLVIMDGRLLWIQDAYTTTDRYPYSEPYAGRLNYIRNSVKVVIDAYDGSATFYVVDSEDALIRTYQAIFPELFVSADEMPEALRAHWRYPEDMFSIQASVYQSYHMKDARVFYNQEDLWAVPVEVYAGNEQPVEPYYIIMRLPGEDREEFLLMLPFTPVNKNNTIGWMAARCDGEVYGKLLAYFFPKERLVYGPSQIENRIQQDTKITEQLALWSRGGSRVIRGNLLLIPLGESKLYVEPVFLQAEAGGLPELKRVIVATGEQVAMEESLMESIASVFGVEAPSVPPEIELPVVGEAVEMVEDIVGLVEQAQQHYQLAQQYLQSGNWTGYGEELGALKAVLDQLEEFVAEAQ